MRNVCCEKFSPLSDNKRSITLIKIGEINEMPADAHENLWIKSNDNDSLDMWQRPSPGPSKDLTY